MELEKLYDEVGWPLYKEYKHCYDAFKIALLEPDKIFANVKMTENIK